MDESHFIGGELYRMGLSLVGPGSFREDRANCPITDAQVSAWKVKAAKLNALGTAGDACFILRHVDSQHAGDAREARPR
jgi:hypothetical protein